MRVAESTARKIKINEVERLDPVTVYIEDLEPGKGKITIECFGEAWSSYWGAMGENNDISSFFVSCNEHYIAKNLSSIRSDIADWESFHGKARKEIISIRKDGELSKEKARELWNEFDLEDYPVGGSEQLWADKHSRSLVDIFGDDWWYSIPQKPNHEYEYLCRIIFAVQEALRSLQEAGE